MADATVTLIGNLTTDPEVRYIGSGAAVATLRLAVTARVKDGDGWKDGETSYFSCSAWRDLGEHAADSLRKGMRVVVVGRLRSRSWETASGERRSTVEVEVDDVGPSLRWATATVERSGNGGRAVASSGSRSGGGWSSANAAF